MDIKQCFHDLFFVVIILCLHSGLCSIDDDYEDSPSTGRCPWIRNKLKNGRVRYRYKGRVAKFLCDSGYELAGKRSSTCVRGQWTNPVPVCVARGCSRVPSTPNGRVTEMYRGALLVYDCNPGYTLDGEASIHCDGRRWSTAPPACVIATDNPETSCDFESPDLCGWTHDLHHDFDWKRNQFSTPSGHVGTGPSFDHTFGENKGGFYLYIEASSPRKINDTARLFSPVYPAHLSGGCFLFWYHMYGATTGGLRVYLKPESHVFDELRPSWQKFGDQGNQWLRGSIIVPVVHENFQIVIEGVRGESYVGDSAIDDVRLTTSLCDRFENDTESAENTAQDSCRGRCREADTSSSCGCNDNCVAASNCCGDFLAICGAGNDTSVQNTDETLPVDYLGKTTSPVTATDSLTTGENAEVQTVITTPDGTIEVAISTRVMSTSVVSASASSTAVSSTSTTKAPITVVSTKPSTLGTSTTEPSTTTKKPTRVPTINSTPTSKPDSSTTSKKSTRVPLRVSTSTSKPDTSPASTRSAKTTKYISTTVSPVRTTTRSTSTTTSSSSTTSTKTTPSTTQSTKTTTQSSTVPSTSQSTKTTTQSTTVPSTTQSPKTTTHSTTTVSAATTSSSKAPILLSTAPSSTSTAARITLPDSTSIFQSTASSTTTQSSAMPPRSSITTESSTRKTYNLRPRTLRTRPVSSTTSTMVSSTKQYTSNTPIKEGTSTISEFKSNIPYTTAWRRYTVSPSIRMISTRSTAKPTTATSTMPTAKLATTSSRYIPRTTGIMTQTTKFPTRITRSTTLPKPTDSYESKASKSETATSNGSFPVVISIVVIVIICAVVGLVYYIRKQRNKRQSKLSDDSEMRFLPENDFMEYSDASALDKILVK